MINKTKACHGFPFVTEIQDFIKVGNHHFFPKRNSLWKALEGSSATQGEDRTGIRRVKSLQGPF